MDSIQCVEKEDQGGILDFWPEPLRCGKSKVVGEYGGGTCLACDAFWTFGWVGGCISSCGVRKEFQL